MADKKNENNEEEFPGYPHYPAGEDIMNSKDNERVTIDVESLAQSKKLQQMADQKNSTSSSEDPAFGTDEETDPGEKVISEADITDEDLIAFNDSDSSYGKSGTLSGEDLDVPGAEDDDENEEIGEEDEENNYYSLGGDAHENLEEDKGE